MLGMVSQCAIVTMSLRRAIFQIFDFKNAMILKAGLRIHEGHQKCHHSIESLWLPIGWVSIPRISFPRKWRGRARLLDCDEAGEESTCDIAVRVWSRQWNELSAVNAQFMSSGCNWNWAVLACDGSPLLKKHMRKPWKTMNRYRIMLLRYWSAIDCLSCYVQLNTQLL